jgi:hypothetical protein
MYLNALWREYIVAGNNYRIEIVCSYVQIRWHITEGRNREVEMGRDLTKERKGQGFLGTISTRDHPPLLFFASKFSFQNFKSKEIVPTLTINCCSNKNIATLSNYILRAISKKSCCSPLIGS